MSNTGSDDEIHIGGVAIKRQPHRHRRRVHQDDQHTEDSAAREPAPETQRLLLDAASNWEHQEHPADVIIHAWGSTFAETLEGLVSGTTAVMTSSLKRLAGRRLTRDDVNEGLDVRRGGGWELGEGSYVVEEDAISGNLTFIFEAPTLNTLAYRILQCGLISLYGECDYLMIKRARVESLSYHTSEGVSIPLDLGMDLTEHFVPNQGESTLWGEDLTLKDNPTGSHEGSYFRVALAFYGELFDRTKHVPGTEIKAITRHCSRVVLHEDEQDHCLIGTDEEACQPWHVYMLVDI